VQEYPANRITSNRIFESQLYLPNTMGTFNRSKTRKHWCSEIILCAVHVADELQSQKYLWLTVGYVKEEFGLPRVEEVRI